MLAVIRKEMKSIIIFILGILFSSIAISQTVTRDSYCLKGDVKFASDKDFPAAYNEIWIPNPDTSLNMMINIQNRYFSQDGIMTNIKYYNRDSLLNMDHRLIYDKKEKKHVASYDYNKNNELTKITKYKILTLDSLYSETFDNKTGDIIQKSRTYYKNGLSFLQIFENVESNYSGKYTIKRDKDGNEIEMTIDTKWDNENTHSVLKYEYLEFDDIGNWTKRIRYSADDKTSGLLTIRRIEYYK